MFDRRFDPRFRLSGFVEATFRMIEDLVVERVNGDELWLLSGVPARPDERSMDRPRPTPPMAATMRVIGGELRHRMRLASGASGEGATRTIVRSGLVRTLPVRILDVSRGGCLLEASVAVEAGAIGAVHVQGGGSERQDRIRVRRCLRVEGGSVFRIGAVFLREAGGARLGMALAPAALDETEDEAS